MVFLILLHKLVDKFQCFQNNLDVFIKILKF